MMWQIANWEGGEMHEGRTRLTRLKKCLFFVTCYLACAGGPMSIAGWFGEIVKVDKLYHIPEHGKLAYVRLNMPTYHPS